MNWDVVKKFAIAVPAGLTIIATFLSAVGVDTIVVGKVTAGVLAGAALVVWVIDTYQRSAAETDAGKAARIANLDAQGTAAVVEKLPVAAQQRVADAMPSTVKVEAVNKDASLPNVPPGR